MIVLGSELVGTRGAFLVDVVPVPFEHQGGCTIRTASVRICRLALLAMGICLFTTSSRADDKLLEETVGFIGTVLFLQTRVPALVIGVVRDGKTAVFGFGKIADGSNETPDRHTILRVGSLTKAFTGQVFASLLADGTVKLTDRLQDRIGWDLTIPTPNNLPPIGPIPVQFISRLIAWRARFTGSRPAAAPFQAQFRAGLTRGRFRTA